MPVEPDKRYNATVVTADFQEGKPRDDGTFGADKIFIKFQTSEGTVDGTIYLSEKAIKRAGEDLIKLGADPEKLKTWEYLDKIGEHIRGGRCSVTTEENEYQGHKSVRVKWINPQRRATPKVASRVAQLFGGPAAPASAEPIDDEPPF